MKLIGFEQHKTFFNNSYKNNKLHHANLIFGKKGIGKATFVNELCKEFLLCKSEIHPDLKIITCLEDKKEISVEQIRQVIEFAYQTSASSANKFIIIDSACELNKNSSNALLKLLEEPLANNYFFLIAHNLNKVIPTLRSRCNLVKIDELNNNQFNQILEDNKLVYTDHNQQFLAMICDNSIALALNFADDFIKVYQLLINSVLDQKISEELLKKISEKNFNFYIVEKTINVFFSRFVKDNNQLLKNFFFNEKECFEFLKLKIDPRQAIKIYEDIFNKLSIVSSLYLDKKLLLINFINKICYEKV
ncbi:MAG: AAA family ATPase [Alphaproteobacteria bacterium]